MADRESQGGFPWQMSDGGRTASGFTEPDVRDCGVRALAHITGRAYGEIRSEIETVIRDRPGRVAADPESVEGGLKRRTLARLLGESWAWVPTHKNSPHYSGDTVRFISADLPATGHLLVSVRDHYSALIDGVIYDTFDPTVGAPVVHGYFTKAA